MTADKNVTGTSTDLTNLHEDAGPAECFEALMAYGDHTQQWRRQAYPGRPCDYSRELALAICDRIAAGETITSIGKDADLPSTTTIYRWLYRYPAFSKAYAYARQMQSHSFVGKAVDAADSATGKDDASAAKVKADTYLKVAGRINPEEYGERRENGNALQINIQTNLDDPSALATKRGEYRITYEDAEVVDTDANAHISDTLDDAGIEF